MSCIWRGTATGNYPDKEWTEDTEDILCIDLDDRNNNEAPFANNP